MTTMKLQRDLVILLLVTLFLVPTALRAEEEALEGEDEAPVQNLTPAPKPKKAKKTNKRYFGTEKPERVDAGVFHVAFAAGGNFYMEPKVFSSGANRGAPVGEYFKDFGFQGGAYFDYDYSEMTENIPLMVRGFVGYKYVLQSVHVFSFEGVARHIWRLSDSATYGIGIGASASVWYRSITGSSPYEETLFLPSFIVETGFEFNPFMIDLKWLINRFGPDTTITGVELYFGFRL